MWFCMFLMMSFLGIFTFTQAVPVANYSAANNYLPYPAAPMQFNGTLGGHEVSHNGTVQEVFAHVKALYIKFELEISIPDKALTSRTPVAGRLCCPVRGQPWRFANVGAIDDGIKHLQGIGNNRIGIPLGTCVRVSCSYNSAIWVCNDNNWWVYPTGWDLYSEAILINNDCGPCGQQFDTDGYNVIVRADKC